MPWEDCSPAGVSLPRRWRSSLESVSPARRSGDGFEHFVSTSVWPDQISRQMELWPGNSSQRCRRGDVSLFSLMIAGAGLFGLVVGLGGCWFTVAVGNEFATPSGLLEFSAWPSAGIRPAAKTTLVVVQLLLISTQWDLTGGLPSHLASAVLPLSGAAILGWRTEAASAGSIADIASSIFGLFYLGYLPRHWLRLRQLSSDPQLLPSGPQWLSAGLVITLVFLDDRG